MNRAVLSSVLAVLAAAATPGRAEPPTPDFNRDVRPILSDKCYFCHGPDEANRQADLRLDDRAAAAYVLESTDLLDRINETDPDYLMPPPESHLALTSADKDVLRRWIESGAEYEPHWSFQLLPESVPVPEVADESWPRGPIDRFVLARLEAEGLAPSPEADPLRWLRRASLDLTGLPPTTEQIARFESERQADASAAYAAAVDRLLASPAFGEHMAVPWLDAARYADSYGYQSDKLNNQWPYRDWVVRAFNDNLPYDDFLTWQIAGDLLPDAGREQRLATAFNRIHRLNNEGGAVFEEWRIENVADRVHTFGTAVLGLTLECARCHDHKYDPISQRDYYAMGAFFNSIDESGVYDRTEKVPCPSLLLPTPQQSAELTAAEEKARVAEETYAAVAERARANTPTDASLGQLPDLNLALAFDRPYEESLKPVYHPSVNDRGFGPMPELVPVEGCPVPRMPAAIAKDTPADRADLPRLAMRMDGEIGITTEGVPPLDRWMPFSVVMTVNDAERSTNRVILAHHSRGTDCGYNGWDLSIEDGVLESRLARVWPGNAISVRATQAIPAAQWCQVAATYDGSSQAGGLKLFLNGEELPTEVVRDGMKKSANVAVQHGGEFVIGQRFRSPGFTGGLIDDTRVYLRDLTPAELRHLATGEPLEMTPRVYASAVDDEARAAKAALFDARRAVVMAEEAMNEIPVMREMDAPRVAYVLARGAYDAPRSDQTRVTRDTPVGFALPFPEDAPHDRLGLATWVTDPRHPLTARVAVNRFWGNFFAEPLVATADNFGLQGELPSHADLLDWLARDFIDGADGQGGWDVKRLCRQIVLSATYRQSSQTDAALRERDPDNRLLARGPAYRLAAEQIRDLALAASGLLSEESGGPPVSPYQPGHDLWRESNNMSPPYEQAVGEDLYRRSLYSVWKRTSPLPNMMALDATTREFCAVKRARTNTPLQALVLLNDTQFVEAARALATQVADEPDAAEQVEAAFLRLTGRRPQADERELLVSLLRDEQSYFADHPEDAEALLSVGQAERPEDVPADQLAALTVVCQAILNLDATVWKR